jgi:tyrosine-protein kinase Etk/Wzc
LLARVEQLRILRASAVGNIRVLEPSEVAQLIGPNRWHPIVFGLFIGLILSSALVFSINAFRRGVDDAREIEELGLPLFATVGKDKRLTGQPSSSALYGLALEDPTSLTVESLRGLRTGLKFGMASSTSKVLMITSCAPSDGKSFISLNLAIVAAKTGSKVLLIDADLRRGMLRHYFGLARNEKGLSDLLTGTSEDYIFHHDQSGLDFLPTGRMPPNPAELLESEAFSNALKMFNDYYDLIIIDAPPALLVADPAIIGQNVGMVMLVVRHLQTSVSEIQAVQKSLATAGVRLSGAIMNQYDERRSRYGRYGRKYGYYYGGYRYNYVADDPKT